MLAVPVASRQRPAPVLAVQTSGHTGELPLSLGVGGRGGLRSKKRPSKGGLRRRGKTGDGRISERLGTASGGYKPVGPRLGRNVPKAGQRGTPPSSSTGLRGRGSGWWKTGGGGAGLLDARPLWRGLSIVDPPKLLKWIWGRRGCAAGGPMDCSTPKRHSPLLTKDPPEVLHHVISEDCVLLSQPKLRSAYQRHEDPRPREWPQARVPLGTWHNEHRHCITAVMCPVGSPSASGGWCPESPPPPGAGGPG